MDANSIIPDEPPKIEFVVVGSNFDVTTKDILYEVEFLNRESMKRTTKNMKKTDIQQLAVFIASSLGITFNDREKLNEWFKERKIPEIEVDGSGYQPTMKYEQEEK